MGPRERRGPLPALRVEALCDAAANDLDHLRQYGSLAHLDSVFCVSRVTDEVNEQVPKKSRRIALIEQALSTVVSRPLPKVIKYQIDSGGIGNKRESEDGHAVRPNKRGSDGTQLMDMTMKLVEKATNSGSDVTKEDVAAAVKTGVSDALQTEMKTETSGLKSDVSAMQSDVTAVKADLSDIKGLLQQVRGPAHA